MPRRQTRSTRDAALERRNFQNLRVYAAVDRQNPASAQTLELSRVHKARRPMRCCLDPSLSGPLWQDPRPALRQLGPAGRFQVYMSFLVRCLLQFAPTP